jgi:hypothetical protein
MSEMMLETIIAILIIFVAPILAWFLFELAYIVIDKLRRFWGVW